MEELENDTPYFRTGIRGDPDHRIMYENHPFDRMRLEREERKEGIRHRKGGGGEGGGAAPPGGSLHDPDGGWEVDSRNLQTEGGGGDDDAAEEGGSDGGGGGGEEGGEEYENPFRPIRIHLETAALDALRTSTNGPQIDFVKNSILPRMRDYWTAALSVVPVSGNLLISSADLQGRLYCGDTEFSAVPASHMSDGVPDADLVLYISGIPSARFCGPSTLAVAVACNFDQVRRERFQTQREDDVSFHLSNIMNCH
jgi:hypothetical protein